MGGESEKTKSKGGPRNDVDWQAIERDYRLGQLTVREIARRYGVAPSSITRRAEKETWPRDLTDVIRAKTRAELLRNTKDATPERNTISQHDIAVAVQTNVQLVREHRKDIGRNRYAVTKLIDELHDAIENIDDIEDDIIEETAGDKDGKRRARMLAAVALPSRAGVAATLASALKTLVPLEREAFNIGGDKRDDDPVSAELTDASVDKLARLLE